MSPNPLNLLPQAVSQAQSQIIYGEVVPPLPNGFGEILYVIQPDWTNKIPFAITNWPACHGDALPLAGAAVLLIADPRGNLRCVWWDGPMIFATGSFISYYFTSSASDVATYLVMGAAPVVTKAATTYPNLSAVQVVANWVTPSGSPGKTFLPAGQYEFHAHASRTPGSQQVRIFAEFWEVTSAGVDVAKIGTTQLATLGPEEVEYRLSYLNQNVYFLQSSSSRLACRMKVSVGGGGVMGVMVYMGGTADSHAHFPTTFS